jgi:hypothetical protein
MEEKSVFWELIISVILRKKNEYVQMSKSVDKKEILRTIADTGIYCSIDKVGTVYLV